MRGRTRAGNRPLRAPGPSIGDDGRVLDDWIAAAKTELGIDLDVDVPGLLDMTREVAHGVARPAAPLTAFLVGYAAARSGGGREAVAEANRRVTALAARWPAPPATGPSAADTAGTAGTSTGGAGGAATQEEPG
ncbi:hypothetical protein ABH925_005326 [Streptacidiphilus sp. EB129]